MTKIKNLKLQVRLILLFILDRKNNVYKIIYQSHIITLQCH